MSVAGQKKHDVRLRPKAVAQASPHKLEVGRKFLNREHFALVPTGPDIELD
jgi:hypothetical protein